jgi:purine nucleoside phosphorylase
MAGPGGSTWCTGDRIDWVLFSTCMLAYFVVGLQQRLVNIQAMSQHVMDLYYSLVPGHPGHLVFGILGGVQVVCMIGRLHAYEGHSMWQVRFVIHLRAQSIQAMFFNSFI